MATAHSVEMLSLRSVPDLQRVGAVMSALASRDARCDDLAAMRRSLKQARAKVTDYARELQRAYLKLEAAYAEPGGNDKDNGQLARLIDQVSSIERTNEEYLHSKMEALEQILALSDSDSPTELRQLRRKSLEIAKDWLALHRDLHQKLLELVAGQPAARQILRARRADGEIDHEALILEIIARFPEILAALAR